MNINEYSSWLLERVHLGEVVRLRLGKTSIGRLPSSTILISNSTYVSRNHAEIEVSPDDKQITIRDLKSVNGVYVNDILFEEACTLLQDGDRIGIGVTVEAVDDMTHPIYRVRYMPFKRTSNEPNPVVEPIAVTNSTQNSNEAGTSNATIVKREALTSSSLPIKTTATPIAYIVLSDDDDDEDKEKKKSEEDKKRNLSRQYASFTDRTVNPGDDLPKTTVAVCNIDDSMITRLTPPPSNTSNYTSDSDSQPISYKPSLSKEPELHCPIIPAIKREIARNTSAEIISVFGETDDVIMNQMKTINPYCYNDLNGIPMHMPTTITASGKKPLCDGDLICLTSDDEDNENENQLENMGQLFVIDSDQTSQSNKEKRANSPNIFDSSLNSSKNNNEDVAQPEQIQSTSSTSTTDKDKEIAQDKPKEVINSTTIKEKSMNKKTKEVITSSGNIKEQTHKIVTNLEKTKEKTMQKPNGFVNSSDKIKKITVEKPQEVVNSLPKIKKKPKEVITTLDNVKEKSLEEAKEVFSRLSEVIKAPTKSFDQADDYDIYEPCSGDEDIEELMFSQVIISDIKAEMANDNDDNEEDNSRDIITPYITMLDAEPQSSASANNSGTQSVFDSSCWLLSEDETDEEQDTKVSNWKKKIFSQSFSTLSQIKEESVVYDYNSQENGQTIDDDEESNDTDTDLYNRTFADPDKVCDDVIDSIQEQVSCKNKINEKVGAINEVNNLDVESDNILDSPIIKQISTIKKRLISNSEEEQEKATTASTCKYLYKLESPLINSRKRKTPRLSSLSDDDELDKDDRKTLTRPKKVVVQETLNNGHQHMDDQPTKQSKKPKNLKCPEETSKKILDLPKKSTSDQNQPKENLRIEKPSAFKNINARRISEQPEKESNGNVQTSRRKSHEIIKRTSIDAEIQAKTLHQEHKETITPTSEKISAFLTSEGGGVATKTIKRGPPLIIDAPQLPRFKGKLRGVSAATTQPQPSIDKRVHSLNDLEKKASAVRESIRHGQTIKELKRKWDKPTAAPKLNSEHKVNIKQRLKDLSEKQKLERDKRESLKRKMPTDTDDQIKMKNPKVKLTTANRGAFLTEAYKIPKIKPKITTNAKVAASAIISAANAVLDGPSTSAAAAAASVRLNYTTSANTAETGTRFCAPTNALKRQSSTEKQQQQLGTFSQQLAMADNIQPPAATVHRTEATRARAQRTTNKITFASMQKNFIESHQNQKKLDSIVTTRSCLSASSSSAKRSKKTVRFNDTPIVHYIDSVRGACKKVDKKDIEPRSSYYDRCMEALGTYKQIDCTNEIIPLILSWSNEYLLKGNAVVDGVGDIIYPMPNQFSSFDHYKSIIFPLMKLEFLTRLDREYCVRNPQSINVCLEHAAEKNGRWTLTTKFCCQNSNQWDATKIDVVILDIGNEKTFGYLSSRWKGAGSWRFMMFEVTANNFGRDFYKSFQNKDIKFRPVLDDVRVEFGAFNAVYQLEQTPLFQKILNPFELLKSQIPQPMKKLSSSCDPYLNDQQKDVLLNTYARAINETTPNITLIEGPPGTGKSCVIANLAMQSLFGADVRTLDKKILICGQSNVAVDVIAQKLIRIWNKMPLEKKFRVVRFGIFDKINSQVQSISLKKLVENEQLRKLQSYKCNIQIENKENMRNQMLDIESEIAEMKSRNIKGTVQEDELIEKQRKLQLMRNITSHTLRPEDERNLHQHFLRNANIVCATLSSCVKLSQFVKYFDICIIDEATQCTEPYTLLPLKFFINSLVLVGDTKQLPATVLSKKATECGLTTSLFTRIQRCLDNVKSPKISNGSGTTTQTTDLVTCSLKTQYRMHPEICKWPNSYFYKNELVNAKSTNQNTKIVPFSVLNLTYTQDDNGAMGKIKNNDEAVFVAKLLKALDGYIPTKYNTYGVITPYANHRDTLVDSLRSYGLTNIMVNTIDSYQGVEKDVIIISNARTNGVGFLSNHRRLNVALTRPKRCLILCGNFKNLEAVPAWRSLLNNARERNLFHEISETCVQDFQRNVIDKIKVKKH